MVDDVYRNGDARQRLVGTVRISATRFASAEHGSLRIGLEEWRPSYGNGRWTPFGPPAGGGAAWGGEGYCTVMLTRRSATVPSAYQALTVIWCGPAAAVTVVSTVSLLLTE